jgi:hypothetical protein
MMPALQDAYGQMHDQFEMFRVDVPLLDDGRIVLVYPGHPETETESGESGLVPLGQWVRRPASTEQVVELLRLGGYNEQRRVIQLLGTPWTREQS